MIEKKKKILKDKIGLKFKINETKNISLLFLVKNMFIFLMSKFKQLPI